MNLRLMILETLLAIEKEDMPAGLIIRQVMDKYDYLDRQERSFLKRVLEGTVERQIELDHIIDSFSKVKTRKLKPVIRAIMRMSVYQLKYMDAVPDSAVCNEAVKLASKKGFSSLKGFVNGVLRNIARNIDDIPYPEEGTPEGLSVRYSCPLWLVEQFISEQGYDTAVKMLEASVGTSDIYIRVNTKKITPEALADELKASGVTCEKAPYLPYALRLKDIDSIRRIPAFEKGLFTVQDLGSMLVTELAGIKKGDTVFDVCAAPGGKSVHALSKLDGTGYVHSFDISDNKLSLIRENVSRSGYSNIDINIADALVYNEGYDKKADVLIADLPCSGLGVLKRKNDIKYNMTPEKEESLAALQWDMLKNVSRYVKPGGIMVFSTCTVHRAENEDNYLRIRDELPFEPLPFYDYLPDELKGGTGDSAIKCDTANTTDVSIKCDTANTTDASIKCGIGIKCDTAKEGYIQLLPGVHECDGFFISKFVRKL